MSGEQFAFIFVREYYIQCHACEVACKSWRNVEPGVNWRHVENIWEGAYPDVKCFSVSVSCLHCAEPACMEVCPEGAITKRPEDGIVLVDGGKCTGCRTCQLLCSFRFQQAYSNSDGAIRINKFEPLCLNVPVLCEHCVNPECVAACPTEALRKDSETGMVMVQNENCTGCMTCVEACPMGAIFPRPEGKGVALCDLCQGDPICAAWCRTKALEWVNKFEAGERKRLVLIRNRPSIP